MSSGHAHKTPPDPPAEEIEENAVETSIVSMKHLLAAEATESKTLRAVKDTKLDCTLA